MMKTMVGGWQEETGCCDVKKTGVWWEHLRAAVIYQRTLMVLNILATATSVSESSSWTSLHPLLSFSVPYWLHHPNLLFCHLGEKKKKASSLLGKEPRKSALINSNFWKKSSLLKQKSVKGVLWQKKVFQACWAPVFSFCLTLAGAEKGNAPVRPSGNDPAAGKGVWRGDGMFLNNSELGTRKQAPFQADCDKSSKYLGNQPRLLF